MDAVMFTAAFAFIDIPPAAETDMRPADVRLNTFVASVLRRLTSLPHTWNVSTGATAESPTLTTVAAPENVLFAVNVLGAFN